MHATRWLQEKRFKDNLKETLSKLMSLQNFVFLAGQYIIK